MRQKAALDVTELELENSRLRTVLENLRDQAASQALAALTAKPATVALGLSYLGRVAAEALEE